jgi:probable F420-dependent oxidoreductase
MDLGRLGIWSIELRTADAAAVADVAAELDEAEWGALWIPGLGGGPLLRDAEVLLRSTRHATVAIGVASIWRHEAVELAVGHATLQAAHGRRLMLGLGVSDSAAAHQAGRSYRPLSAMETYLDLLDTPQATVPREERLIGALGPRMVELGARRTAGVHPFAVTPEHSATLRELLGPHALLAPHQAVILETNAETARSIARGFISTFVTMDHYARSLHSQGFLDADLAHGGSDRLVDALIAWGDVDVIAKRIQAHHDAGADHVGLHVISSQPGLPVSTWRRLSPLTAGTA